MIVRYLQCCVGPEAYHFWRPGDVAEWPEEQAKSLIRGGLAEQVLPSEVSGREVAEVDPATETAVSRPGRKARKRKAKS